MGSTRRSKRALPSRGSRSARSANVLVPALVVIAGFAVCAPALADDPPPAPQPPPVTTVVTTPPPAPKPDPAPPPPPPPPPPPARPDPAPAPSPPSPTVAPPAPPPAPASSSAPLPAAPPPHPPVRAPQPQSAPAPSPSAAQQRAPARRPLGRRPRQTREQKQPASRPRTVSPERHAVVWVSRSEPPRADDPLAPFKGLLLAIFVLAALAIGVGARAWLKGKRPASAGADPRTSALSGSDGSGVAS